MSWPQLSMNILDLLPPMTVGVVFSELLRVLGTEELHKKGESCPLSLNVVLLHGGD